MFPNNGSCLYFSRLVLDGFAGVKFIVEMKPIHTWAILKAHLSLYRNFFKFLKKRQRLQKKHHYHLHTSVVWQYFILCKKRSSGSFVSLYGGISH